MPRVTFDANRVTHPTQRRFNAAWLERAGAKVRLLPRVAMELMHGRIDPSLDLAGQTLTAEHELAIAANSGTHLEILLREFDIWWGPRTPKPP